MRLPTMLVVLLTTIFATTPAQAQQPSFEVCTTFVTINNIWQQQIAQAQRTHSGGFTKMKLLQASGIDPYDKIDHPAYTNMRDYLIAEEKITDDWYAEMHNNWPWQLNGGYDDDYSMKFQL